MTPSVRNFSPEILKISTKFLKFKFGFRVLAEGFKIVSKFLTKFGKIFRVFEFSIRNCGKFPPVEFTYLNLYFT